MSRSECPNCLGGGCELCGEVPGLTDRIGWYTGTGPEPWPKETWYDLTDQDLEQLVCDGLDELTRRGKRRERLERLWTL